MPQTKQALRKGTGIALTILNPGTRRQWTVSGRLQPLCPPKERPRTHCTEGWVDHRADVNWSGNSRYHQFSNAPSSIPQQVAIPTTLYRLTFYQIWYVQLWKASGYSEDLLYQQVYIYIYIYIYICVCVFVCVCVYGFKTFFYVVPHLDSIASYLPTGLHLGLFRSWPSLYLPSSFSSVFLVLSFVSASTSMLFWVIFLLPFSEHGRTK